MEAAISSSSFAISAAVVFLLARLFDRRIAWTFALLCAVYVAADDFITGLPNVFRSLDVLGGNWNWTGKVMSLVFSALIIASLGLSSATTGLTFKQRHTGIGLIALVFFIAWGACLGLLFKPGAPDAE